MARIGSSAALSGIQAGGSWRLLRNLLGGLLIVAVWLSLWAWMAIGVVGPLSAVSGAGTSAAALAAAGGPWSGHP